MTLEQMQTILYESQTIVDLAAARLRDERTTDPNTMRDLTEIISCAARLRTAMGAVTFEDTSRVTPTRQDAP